MTPPKYKKYKISISEFVYPWLRYPEQLNPIMSHIMKYRKNIFSFSYAKKTLYVLQKLYDQDSIF